MGFIRKRDLICAPERNVWLFKANALDQLAALLQTKCGDGIPRDTENKPSPP